MRFSQVKKQHGFVEGFAKLKCVLRWIKVELL